MDPASSQAATVNTEVTMAISYSSTIDSLLCRLYGWSLACLHLQAAKQALRGAVASADLGDLADLKHAIADTCIDSLQAVDGGFSIVPVDLGKVGHDYAFRDAKAASNLSAFKVKAVVSMPQLSSILTVQLLPKSVCQVLLNFAALVPDASSDVRSLLPLTIWHDPPQQAEHHQQPSSSNGATEAQLRAFPVSRTSLKWVLLPMSCSVALID